jgi:hypothetical protein
MLKITVRFISKTYTILYVIETNKRNGGNMNKNFKNIAIHESTHEQARFLSKMQNKSIAAILEELIDRVFQIACTYDKQGLNIDFETCVTDSTLLISVTGRNRLLSGEIKLPPSEEDKIVKTVIIKHQIDAKKVK